jgi:RNA polymerase sigma factor (sigma-70 family)
VPSAKLWRPNSTGDFPTTLESRTTSTERMQTDSWNHENNRGGRLDFEELVEAYYRPLYKFALSLTQSEADASDLTQDTFLTWRMKGQQLRDASKVRAWLFTTLHRAFLQNKRRETRFPHFMLDEMDPELPWISPADLSQLDTADLLKALAKMDDSFRAPLALFYLQDCPYKEIARILGVPLGTVKSRIARGIAQLQKHLAVGDERNRRAVAGQEQEVTPVQTNAKEDLARGVQPHEVSLIA